MASPENLGAVPGVGPGPMVEGSLRAHAFTKTFGTPTTKATKNAGNIPGKSSLNESRSPKNLVGISEKCQESYATFISLSNDVNPDTIGYYVLMSRELSSIRRDRVMQ